MTASPVGRFVRALAGEASRRGQKLVVLRNYQRLPDEGLGRDLDVLVRRRRLGQWASALRAACRGTGADVRLLARRFDCRKYAVGPLGEGDLEVDLIPRLHWRGVEWLSVEAVLRRALPFREGIWIPDPADECVITFCHSYLYGGRIKEKYLPLMSAQVREATDRVVASLRRVFGAGAADRIIDALRDRDVAGLLANATRYRLGALWRGMNRDPVRFLLTAVAGYWMDCRTRPRRAAS